jgi:hypothetical protein
MSPNIIAAVVDEVIKFCRGKFDAVDQRLELLGLPEKGDRGDRGVGIKAITQTDDLARLGLEFDDGDTLEILLPPGPKGDKGEPGGPGEKGDPGFAAEPDAVAALLKSDAEFLQAVQPQGQRAEKWVPSIYRKGCEVLHYMGRVYVALKDTTDEPGDSLDWERIGSGGWRHTGGYKNARSYEAGDLYVKDGATWIFDGERGWLMAPRPYTAADQEKADRKHADDLAAIRRQVEALQVQLIETAAVAQLAAEALEVKQ